MNYARKMILIILKIFIEFRSFISEINSLKGYYQKSIDYSLIGIKKSKDT